MMVKKLIGSMLILSLCLTACGNTTTVEREETKKQKASAETLLSLDVKNTIEDYMDFTLLKIETTDEIKASVNSHNVYSNVNAEKYVDIIFDVTNTGTEDLVVQEMMTASAVGANNQTFLSDLYLLETEGNTYLEEYGRIAPLSKGRVHCAISVPGSETELRLILTIKDQQFIYNYTLGETVTSELPLTVGQTLESPDFATLKFIGAEYMDTVMPSNTSGYYQYYEVKSPDQTYFVAKFELTNYQGTAKECESFFGTKVTFSDKYTYDGFIVAEDLDGSSLSNYESIDPLTTRKVYVLTEVPKVVMEQSGKMLLTFDGKEYTYSF